MKLEPQLPREWEPQKGPIKDKAAIKKWHRFTLYLLQLWENMSYGSKV